jgi:hypothetical protein
MQTIGEAFLSARDNAELRPETYDTSAQEFGRGVGWVRNFLVPAVEQGNSELQQHHIAIRLDLNLDSRSTNHAHADFWFIETGGHEGPKYSINVLGGREVWLYKAGAPGRALGTTDNWGDDQLRKLLCGAAKEFGALMARDRTSAR